ncbi:MAG: DUF4097 family beta strand repeat-containing protein [Terracidiphilus sp.]
MAIAVSLALAATAAVPARAAEATFERDLTVSGRADLTVVTGSGSIHLTSGPAGRLHIFARVKSSWGGSDEQVQEIAAHPPIEQTGNIVRIGESHQHFGNISIDYDIQAPADSYLDAGTGSGNMTDDGVGANAKLSTGSGSIHATGLQGGFALGTGSGDIYAEQAGAGDVKAETGSGSIELKNLHGGLRAQTGSGSIKVSGAPVAPWRIETGSGSVELWTGNAGLTLDAETGSGSVHCDREIVSQGNIESHHVKGKIGGGGPLVRVETGSGSIRIH